jgi:hypothetical protein
MEGTVFLSLPPFPSATFPHTSLLNCQPFRCHRYLSSLSSLGNLPPLPPGPIAGNNQEEDGGRGGGVRGMPGLGMMPPPPPSASREENQGFAKPGVDGIWLGRDCGIGGERGERGVKRGGERDGTAERKNQERIRKGRRYTLASLTYFLSHSC